MEFIAKATALVGGTVAFVRRMGSPEHQAFGSAPDIPEARKQGIMTLKMPVAEGWKDGRLPTCAPGLTVNAFASGLDHPRWIEVLPNGDVLVAESKEQVGPPKTMMDHAAQATMRRVKAIGKSANRVTLWRDADGDGTAEIREVFVENQNQPFGMALVGKRFYLGNTDGIRVFDYTPGDTALSGSGETLVAFKPHGHWTRSLIVSPDGTKIYAGVGSLSNIGDQGMEVEEGRAAIWELDVATGQARVFASGLRNAVGMAWEPVTGKLWTAVNERDGLGDETPPDYLTSVEEGGFYGWPYCYWGQTVDDRVPAGSGDGRQGDHAGLCPRRPHGVARALLDARRHAAGLRLGHGDRPARVVEPLQAEWLQADLRALRERKPERPVARHPFRLSVGGRETGLWPPGRRGGGTRWEIAPDGG